MEEPSDSPSHSNGSQSDADDAEFKNCKFEFSAEEMDQIQMDAMESLMVSSLRAFVDADLKELEQAALPALPTHSG